MQNLGGKQSALWTNWKIVNTVNRTHPTLFSIALTWWLPDISLTWSDSKFVKSRVMCKYECKSLRMVSRARNNGRSTDNVRTDCGFDRSKVRLAGHVDRSKFTRIENEINLRFLLFSCFSCYLSSRCVLRNFDMKSWWYATRAVVYNSRIETNIGIRPLPTALSYDSWEINS